MTELYPLKSTPLRYHLVRPLGRTSSSVGKDRPEAERQLRNSVERMEALQATVTGVVSDQDPMEALSDVVTALAAKKSS